MSTQPDDLDFADIDHLITMLADAGVTASMHEPDVRPPAVWIRFDALPVPSQLGSCTVRLTLFPVVGKIGTRAAQNKALAQLWNKVRPVINQVGGPSGDVVPTGLVLPGNPAALPALAVPLDLITVNEGDTP